MEISEDSATLVRWTTREELEKCLELARNGYPSRTNSGFVSFDRYKSECISVPNAVITVTPVTEDELAKSKEMTKLG